MPLGRKSLIIKNDAPNSAVWSAILHGYTNVKTIHLLVLIWEGSFYLSVIDDATTEQDVITGIIIQNVTPFFNPDHF